MNSIINILRRNIHKKCNKQRQQNSFTTPQLGFTVKGLSTKTSGSHRFGDFGMWTSQEAQSTYKSIKK